MQTENLFLEFIEVIDKEARDLNFGNLNITIMLVNGVPVLNTMRIVRQKRRTYRIDNYSGK